MQRQKLLNEIPALRWLVLVLISSLMFSTYYFYDFFSPLRDLMETDLGINSEEFGKIIGLTTIANVFGMIIIGGIILDKWGIRLAGLAFGGLATLGSIIAALASIGYFGDDKSSIITGLIIGRILFGSGLEVVCVVVTRTIVKWFKGYELALAMAINMGFGRLGSALAIALSLDIAGVKVSPAVVFAASVVGLSLIFFVIYLFFDIKLDKQLKAKKEATALQGISGEPEEEFKFSDLVKLITNKSFIYITLLCVAFYSAVFPLIMYAPDLLVNKFGFSYTLPQGANVVVFGSEIIGNTLVYLVVFLFALGITLIPNNIRGTSNKIFARIVIIGLFLAIVILNKDMISIWLQNGPKTSALIPLGTIIFTPIFGNYVDKKGKAASLMIYGSLLLIFASLSLSVFSSSFLAYFGLLSLGIAFSLVPAAMWPAVAKIVPEYRLGTAYATMFTVQNWGLLLFFWGIGALLIAIPVNSRTKESIDAVRMSIEVKESEDANLVVLEFSERLEKIVEKPLSAEISELLIETQNEVLDIKTKERVSNTLEEISTKIISKQPQAEEYLERIKANFSKYGFLTAGEISELIKLMQANGLLNFYDYTIPIFLLVFCGLISIFLAFKLKQSDKKQGYGLELPFNE